MLCVLSLCPFIRRTPVFPPLSKVPAEFPGTSGFPAERRIIQFSPSRCVSPQTMRFPHKTARRTILHPSRSRAFCPSRSTRRSDDLKFYRTRFFHKLALRRLQDQLPRLSVPARKLQRLALLVLTKHPFSVMLRNNNRKTQQLVFHIFVKLNRQHKTPPNFHALSSIVVKSFAQRNLTSSSAPPSTLQSAAVALSPLLRCPVPSVCNTSFRQANPASTASRSAFPPYRAHTRTPRRNAAPS